MILVTGGTGFIGKALIRHLVEIGQPVRTLIRPARRNPNLPPGVPVDVAVCSLTDERGLRAAMVGIDTVYHLAGAERRGKRAKLLTADLHGTRAVVQAAGEAGVGRIFYLSHLGADRASAFEALKTKGIAEEFIRRSGLDYTILRSAVVFGPDDGLTTGLARLLKAAPIGFPVPGDGKVLLQPLWVEDLATCLAWALDDPETINRLFEVGGPEYLSFDQIVELVMRETGIRRRILHMGPPYLRWFTQRLEWFFSWRLIADHWRLPVSEYWLDYLAVNRTCALDTIPRIFNLMPSRISQRLAYLHSRGWQRTFARTSFQR